MIKNEIELAEREVSVKRKALDEAQREVNKIRDRAILTDEANRRNKPPLDAPAAEKAFEERDRLQKELDEAERGLMELKRK